MLNINSPTVRSMMDNIPNNPLGNIPSFQGHTPVIETVDASQAQQIPYQSPKEMLMNGGYQNIYSPTYFGNSYGMYNNPYIGTRNSYDIQRAFSDYSNPYMNNNFIGGYNPQYSYGYIDPYQQNYNNMYAMPMDNETMALNQMAIINGMSYKEQVENESKVYKALSSLSSTYLGRGREEADECRNQFNIYNRYEPNKINKIYQNKENDTSIKVQLTKGDNVIYTPDYDNKAYSDLFAYKKSMYERNRSYMDYVKSRSEYIERSRQAQFDYMYNNAVERKYDNTNMLDFFNNGGASAIMADMLAKQEYFRKASQIGSVYNKDDYRQELAKTRGLKTREEQGYADRYFGRFGTMPNGTPVSPGHDPSVASSFSYDPSTGMHYVTAPNFMKNKIEEARQKFINSVDSV